VGEVIVIKPQEKWRDTAWKIVLCSVAESAIDYLMPDLAADMDRTKEINTVSGIELFSEGSDTNKYMREADVFFNIPMLSGEDESVALFAEQQHETDVSLPERIFQTYVRLREKWRLPTTCIVIYTGSAPDVNTYAVSSYGLEISMKYRTCYVPGMNADELRADNRPFARVMQAARLSLDAGKIVELREKHAMEVLKATIEQDYDNGKKSSIIPFIRRIFKLNDPEISELVKGEFEKQMIPLKEYAHMVELQAEREEAAEEALEKAARSLLADGMPLQQVAKHTELPIEDLQELVLH
jgi:hypothetical protein